MTASIYVGGAISGIWYGKITDQVGRRPALFWAALLTIFAVILQAAAQNSAMFIIARILIGLGTSASGITGPTYLAETLPLKWRAWGLGFFNDFYYVVGCAPILLLSTIFRESQELYLMLICSRAGC
jgi:MFS family permease